MEGGADVSAASGADGLTPLMLIAAQTSPAEGARFLPGSTRPSDIAKGLVERGAKVDAQAKNGMTALMIAASHNSAPMIGESAGLTVMGSKLLPERSDVRPASSFDTLRMRLAGKSPHGELVEP